MYLITKNFHLSFFSMESIRICLIKVRVFWSRWIFWISANKNIVFVEAQTFLFSIKGWDIRVAGMGVGELSKGVYLCNMYYSKNKQG